MAVNICEFEVLQISKESLLINRHILGQPIGRPIGRRLTYGSTIDNNDNDYNESNNIILI